MTPYESWLRAVCKNALVPGFLERPVEELLKDLQKKREFWLMWVNKTGGNPYPPGDSRNSEEQPDQKSRASKRLMTPLSEIGRSRWTDPITYSLMWDKNGNLIYPKDRKAQIEALQREIEKESNEDGSLTGLGHLCQAQLIYILAQDA